VCKNLTGGMVYLRIGYGKELKDDLNRSKTINWLLFIAIMLVGANLRVPLTSVGPLVPMIRDSLEISNAAAGFLTTIPLLAFAFISPIVPKLADRFSMERAIYFSLIFLMIGFIFRSFFNVYGLYIGTVVIGTSIAVGNVLLPGFIKVNFPFRVGIVTGLYSVVMNFTGAIGSGVSVPLSSINGFKWNGSLFFWFLLTSASLIVWKVQMKKKNTIELSVQAGE